MKKKFDCVQMKQLGAKKVQEKISGMTREEEIMFWKKRSQHLRQYQEVVKEKHNKSDK